MCFLGTVVGAEDTCEDHATGDCYCLRVRYEPCYNKVNRCEYVDKMVDVKHCRWVAQQYEKQCVRYVPKRYTEVRTRYVPETYTVQECRRVPVPGSAMWNAK